MSQNGVFSYVNNNHHNNNNHLNPTAQEFWPTYPTTTTTTFLQPQLPQPFLLVPQPQLQLQLQLPQQVQVQETSYIPEEIPPSSPTPTRALLLSAVPSNISESSIRNDLEIFGDVRAVQMERIRDGILTVHFYDLRASHAALTAIREQHMQQQQRLRFHFEFLPPSHHQHLPLPLPPNLPGVISGRVVWAHFTIPVTHAFPDGLNQGTLVIFNLDPIVSTPTLKNIFKVFGPVKELRETPMKRHQRFVEFFDIRDASRALAEMAGKEINGRSVMIEYSRPGGHFNRFNNNYHRNNYHNNNNNHPFNYNYNHNVKQFQMKPNVHSPPPPPTPPPQQHRTVPFRNRKMSPRQHQVGARRRRSPISSEESVEAAMGRLALRPQSAIQPNCDGNGKKGNGGNVSGLEKSKPKVVRPWKGRQKNYDPRYLIKEEAIIIIDGGSDCVKDVRTTVMIKNIPNKYSQKLLLNMLDNHCIHCNEQIVGQDQPLSSYDFVYLPIDFNNKCNVGYGFVNMTSPEATLRLYKAFHHQHWEVFNSRKICEVTYARVQGLEALKEHFKNSKFACENDEYLPVVFSPPRDGRQLASPLPIVYSNTLSAASSPTIHHNTDMDAGDLTSSSEDYDNDHHHQVHPINDNNDDDVSGSSFDDGEDMTDVGSEWCSSKK